jgi:hypothetical protein
MTMPFAHRQSLRQEADDRLRAEELTIRDTTWNGLQYRADVDVLMQDGYGLSWQDACGDVDPLVNAMRAGQSPAEFVDWFGMRYDLIPRSDWA